MAPRTLRRFCATALVFAGLCVPAAAAINQPVLPPMLPLFSGPCGTATAGSATFNCNSLLGAANTWGATQTAPGSIYSGSYPSVSWRFPSNASGQRGWVAVMDTSGNIQWQTTNDSYNGTAAPYVMGETLWTFNVPATGLTPATNDNSTKLDTTANSQNRLSHVASATALAAWGNTGLPVERDGFATAGDGGRARYNWSSAACTAADGGSQITATAGGCWNIDWSSIGNVATPMLFENVLTATDDTAAIAAAVATNKHVVIPTMPAAAKRDWTISKDIPQTVQGQIIEGDDRTATRLVINSNAGFSKGVFVPTNAAGGPKFRNIVWIFAQSGTTIGAITQYVPAVYTLNVPDTHLEHVSAYPCWDCFNFQGNSGQSTFEDVHLSAFHCGITLDGAQDTVRARDIHFFPYGMSGGTYTLYMMFPGQSGAPAQHGLCLKRVDDFKLETSLFIGGTAMDISASPTYGNGAVAFSGFVTDTWFDVYPAVTMAGGSLTVTGGFASVDTDGTHGLTSFVNSGGNLTIAGSHLQVNSNGTGTTSAVGGGLVSSSGDTLLTGTILDLLVAPMAPLSCKRAKPALRT